MTRFEEEVREGYLGILFPSVRIDWTGLQGKEEERSYLMTCFDGGCSHHRELDGGSCDSWRKLFQIPRWARLGCFRHRLIPGGGNLEPEQPSAKPNICNC